MTFTDRQREALLLLHDAESEQINVRTSTTTCRPPVGPWLVNGPTAKSLVGKGLVRYMGRNDIALTAAGCGEAADLAAKR